MRSPRSDRSQLHPILEVAALDSLREEWTALAAPTGNVFSSWEWASLWWKHNGAGREPLVTTCRDSHGQLVAIFPFYLWTRRPTRVLRLVGHGPADLLEPLVRQDHRSQAGDLLQRSLAMHRCGLLFAEELPQSQAWHSVKGATIHRRATIPLLHTGGFADWETYLATLSRKLRYQLRQNERTLVAEGATFRLADDPARLPGDLDALFALHRNRFSDEESPAFAGMEAFHRDFAAAALGQGWLRLWLLEVGETAVAAWYGFRFGRMDWFYQTGRDPEWDRLSVGKALIAHTIREAIADGIQTYSFGRGDVPYKARLAHDSMGFESILLPRSLIGHGAEAAARVIRRSSRLKRVLRGPLQA